MIKRDDAEEVLKYMIALFLSYLEEFSEELPGDNKDFIEGERTAYVECLEIIQNWEKASVYGLDFNIENRYPL